ncbi:MAG: extracellular solute-binding protein [Deltaproteobacteria bacterium]|nr:extracellular solute-binding protein [Deltaproteobacteria bacterium]
MVKYLVSFLAVLGLVSEGAPASLLAAESGSQRLIKAAQKSEELNSRFEGDINYWTTEPSGNDLLKVEEAFNKRFKLKVKLKQTPLTSVEVANRFVVSAQAGRPAEGDITINSPPTLIVLRQNGFMEDFDWSGVFSQEFPEIQRRINRIPPQYRNKALEIYHLVYVIGYRADRLKKDELPKTWEELANPKWAGRFAVANQGYPFNYLLSVPGWDEQKMLNLARAIRDNRAVFVKGGPGGAAALQSGDVSLAVGSAGNFEEVRARGIPVDWVALPGTIMTQKNLVVPKGAPHINLARLFGAWLTTEGRELFETVTKDGLAWPEENSLLASKLRQLGLRDSDFILIDTAEKDELGAKMMKKIRSIYLGK